MGEVNTGAKIAVQAMMLAALLMIIVTLVLIGTAFSRHTLTQYQDAVHAADREILHNLSSFDKPVPATTVYRVLKGCEDEYNITLTANGTTVLLPNADALRAYFSREFEVVAFADSNGVYQISMEAVS